MKQTKRFLGLIAAALLTTSAWAQTMTFTYAGGAEGLVGPDGPHILIHIAHIPHPFSYFQP